MKNLLPSSLIKINLLILLIISILIGGEFFFFSFTLGSSQECREEYNFEFPDYHPDWGKKIVAWGDEYHYQKGGRSWNEVRINLPLEGKYEISVFYRADSGTSQIHEEFKVLIDGNYIGQTTDPNQGDDWEEEYLGEYQLEEGEHLVKVLHLWNWQEWGPQSVIPLEIRFSLKKDCQPILTIGKRVDKSLADPGEELTYTLFFENKGTNKATQVKIIDDYDEAYLSILDNGGGIVSEGKIIWEIGTLDSGESGTKTFKAKIKNELPPGTTLIENQAEIESLETETILSELVTTTIIVTLYPPQVETKEASEIEKYRATLNGSLLDLGGEDFAFIWFQWGEVSSYSYQTFPYLKNNLGEFKQTIYNLSPNTIYHFRAVAKNNQGTVYGEDKIFQTLTPENHPPIANAGPDREIFEEESVTLLGAGYDPDGDSISFSWSCNGGSLSDSSLAQPLFDAPEVEFDTYYSCTLTVTDSYNLSDSDSLKVLVKNRPLSSASPIISLEVKKSVRNLSRGDSIWYKSLDADFADLLEFKIKITSKSNIELEDLMVKDDLPQNLLYQGHLKIDGVSDSRNLTLEAIEIGNLAPGETRTLTFWVKVSSRENFASGITNLINTALVYNTQISQTATAKVKVEKERERITKINTAITPTFFTSLLFPLLGAFLLVLVFRSKLLALDKLIEERKRKTLQFRAEKRLRKKTTRIRERVFSG